MLESLSPSPARSVRPSRKAMRRHSSPYTVATDDDEFELSKSNSNMVCLSSFLSCTLATMNPNILKWHNSETKNQHRVNKENETGIEIYSVRSIVRKKPHHPSFLQSCEFIAPHSVEAWIDTSGTNSSGSSTKENRARSRSTHVGRSHGARGPSRSGSNRKNGGRDHGEEEEEQAEQQENTKPVQVIYFQPSRCACLHCLLSERLELPVPHPGRQCLDI